MKTKGLFFIVVFFALVMGIAGCDKKESSEECERSGEEKMEVTNQSGTIVFNEELQRWGISVYEEGTYDEVQRKPSANPVFSPPF